MKPLLRKSLGLGALLTLLAGPALAQPYYDRGYDGAPYHTGWQHERQETMWRAHERHEAWWHANHGYRYDEHGGNPYR